jgi:hypothetical protein
MEVIHMLTLRQLCLVAAELEPALADLTAVLGLSVCYRDPNVEIFGLENALLPVGTDFIEVVSPVEEDTAAGRYLERRGGDGGYMIITQASSAEAQAACRSRAEALGVRVAWEHPLETGHYMQLHPADTGGCFLEIDWHETNDHQGDWHPAGGTTWKPHVRSHVVSVMTGAELQSPNPLPLAEKWSAITGLPLQTQPDGTPEIRLNNAALRFVDETDGRGEGLGGIDIVAADPATLLATARERGMTVSDSRVTICGVRFTLLPQDPRA